MPTYVMADIHGEYDRFEKILGVIGFSGDDELYVIGDVIDRGHDGVRILQTIMKSGNMHLILGNHEYMCMQFFSGQADEKIRRRWNRNGNYYTLAGLDTLTGEERKELFSYLRGVPDCAELKVGGRSFVLVHGYPADNTHDRVWNRPTLETVSPYGGGTEIIIGHTPVCEYVCPGSNEDMYVYSKKLTDAGDHFRILHAKGFTDIDCCCGYGMSAGRLACLRLDDGEEFYA